MAILIGVLEAVFALAVAAVLASLITWLYMRRGKKALPSAYGNELATLREEHETEIEKLNAVHKSVIRQTLKDLKHQAVKCLIPIKGELHLIMEEMPNQTDPNTFEWQRTLKNSLEEIGKYEWRLTQLIENMDLVSALEAPDFTLHFSQVKVDTLVGDVVTEFQKYASPKGIRLVWWRKPEEFPLITAHRVSLRQVFINLIDNAIKYCGENGEVDVALEADEDKNLVSVKVIDTGPGIPEYDQQHIFKKGYRVEEVRDRPPKAVGQGLGLYIAKVIVEKHGGTIAVTSELGKGTTFTIALPIRQA
jgi:signal transduction histidine kinase